MERKPEMTLPDGPGWSPDGGRCWINDNVVYWHDGEISDLNEGGVIRFMNYVHNENYYKLSKLRNAEIWTQ